VFVRVAFGSNDDIYHLGGSNQFPATRSPKMSLVDKNMVESFCQHGLVFLAAVHSIQRYVYRGQVGILFSPRIAKLHMPSTNDL